MWIGTDMGAEGCKGGTEGHTGDAEGGTEGCAEAWRGLWRGCRGGCGRVERGSLGKWRDVNGMQRGHGGDTEGHGGIHRGVHVHGCHWLPLATIDLVGDNRVFEV